MEATGLDAATVMEPTQFAAGRADRISGTCERSRAAWAKGARLNEYVAARAPLESTRRRVTRLTAPLVLARARPMVRPVGACCGTGSNSAGRENSVMGGASLKPTLLATGCPGAATNSKNRFTATGCSEPTTAH